MLQGIYFYQKTHMEELQLEKIKNAILQVFIDTGITPFEDGRWNQYRRDRDAEKKVSSLPGLRRTNTGRTQAKTGGESNISLARTSICIK